MLKYSSCFHAKPSLLETDPDEPLIPTVPTADSVSSDFQDLKKRCALLIEEFAQRIERSPASYHQTGSIRSNVLLLLLSMPRA